MEDVMQSEDDVQDKLQTHVFVNPVAAVFKEP